MDNQVSARIKPPPGFSYVDGAAPAVAPNVDQSADPGMTDPRPAPPPGFSYAPAAQQQAPVIQNPNANTGDFMRGLKTSAHQLPQLTGGAVALAGDALSHAGKALGGDGSTGKAVLDYGMGVYKKHEDDTQQLSKDSDSLTHVLKHPSEVGNWLKYNAGYMGGQMLEGAAVMGAGALAGSEAPGVGNAAGAVAGLVAKPMIERMVLKKAAKLIAEKGLSEEAATVAAKQAVKKTLGAEAGAAIAGGGLNFTQEAGSIYPDAVDQAKSEGRQLTGGDLAKVTGAAAGAAGVDTAFDRFQLGRILHGVPVADGAEQAAKSALRKRTEAAGKEMLTQGTVGGATELAQTAIERAGAGQSMTDADAVRDYVDSTGAGVVGGVMGGAGAGLRSQKADQPVVQPPGAVPDDETDAPAAVDGARPVITNGTPPAEPDEPMMSVSNFGATPGSLTEAANTLSQSAPATAPAPAAPAAAAPTSATPGPAPAPGAAPWVNAETGEVTAPSKGDLTKALADYITQTYQQAGHMRVDTQAVADAWGVPRADVNKVRGLATKVATARVKAQESGQAPAGGVSDTTAATDQSAAPVESGADTDQKGASIPFMITQKMRAELKGLGHTDADIAAMTPQDAHDTLQAGQRVLGPAQDLLGHQQPASDEATQHQAAAQAEADKATAAKAKETEKDGATDQKEADGNAVPDTTVADRAGKKDTRAEGSRSEGTPAKAPQEEAAAPRADGAAAPAAALAPSETPAAAPIKQYETPAADQKAKRDAIDKGFADNKAAIAEHGFKAGDTVTFDNGNGKRVTGVIAKGDKAGMVKDMGVFEVEHPGRNGTAISTVAARLLLRAEPAPESTTKAPSAPSQPAATAAPAPTRAPNKGKVKWFGLQSGADNWIASHDMQATHHVVQSGRRFEIHPNEAPAKEVPAAPAAAADTAKAKPAAAPAPTAAATKSERDALRQKMATDGLTRELENARQIVAKGGDPRLVEQAQKRLDEATGAPATETQAAADDKTTQERAQPPAGQSEAKAPVEQPQSAPSGSSEITPSIRESDAVTEASASGAAEAKKSATTTPLDDFGERLEGARKFLPPGLKEELGDEQIASQPLSKFWPADAYQGIEDPAAAALAFAARAEIPAKPRLASKVKRWVGQVKMLRSLLMAEQDAHSVAMMEEMARKSGHRLEGFFAKVRLLAQLPRESWGRVEKVGEYPDARRMKSDEELKADGIERIHSPTTGSDYFHVDPKTGERGPRIVAWGGRAAEHDGLFKVAPFSSVTVDGKTHQFDGAGSIGPDEVQKVKDLLAGDGNKKVAGLTKADFEIRSYRNRGETFINRKGDAEKRPLQTFTGKDAVAQARAWLADNVPALEAAWEKVKTRDNVSKAETRRDANRERVGADHRNGKDVTPEMFEQALGFRGVQFGNWVGQGKGAKDRQGMLNAAYDALLDLADLLGIPSKAISLNGSLGLSLGARGSGRNNAHFEPSNLVINLTKTKGAGNLGHEWFHALDNYFSRLRGGEVPFTGNQDAYRRGNYITYKPESAWVHKVARAMAPRTSADLRTRLQRSGEWDAGKSLEENADIAGWKRDPAHKQGVRPEVEQAFADLVQALNDSPMAARASKLDGSKSGGEGYWHRIIERGARSFENYVISKLALRGQSNDFLANIRDWREWEAAGKNEGRYPYLKPEEEAPVVGAFDKLFDTLETKPGENGNVALFSRDADTTSDEPFYSALTRSVDTAKGAPKTADAAAWKQWMDGAQRRGEFKQAERDWLGVDQWLTQQDGKVTREQLQQFVRDNQVQVQETELGKSRNQLYDEQNTFSHDMHAKYGDGWMNKATPAELKHYADLENQAEGPNLATKFASYQLPGGKNYQELLLTLPVGRTAARFEARPLGNAGSWQVWDTAANKATLITSKDNAFIAADKQNREATGTPVFQSSHFQKPNILAHVRFNERTDADGKKVLFLEEVQSDWHQAGRRHGYAGDPVAARFDTREKAEAANQRAGGTGVVEVGNQFSFIPKQSDRVPNAPLKKEWPMLAMKRMVRYAAQNGFDRIAWTTGEQQAARYDLSKQVDGIRVTPGRNDDQVHVMIQRKGAKEFTRINGDTSSVDKAKLADTIGKDLAEKALAQLDEAKKSDAADQAAEFHGIDLKVGGEGMQAFYDRMLPNEVNKWAKPFGGKVGDTRIDVQGRPEDGHGTATQYRYEGPTLTGEQVFNASKDAPAVAVERQLRDVADIMKTGMSLKTAMERYGSISAARHIGGDLVAKANVMDGVHSLGITPAMREAALGGLPMFRQDGSQASASDASTPAQEAHAARIRQIATLAMAKWQGNDVPAMRVVATPEQLPQSARRGEDGRFSAAYKRAAGMYDGKTIWIVASAHTTNQAGMQKLLTTMAHEGVGHYGVDRIVDRELGVGAWAKIEAATERLRANPAAASESIRSVLESVSRRYPDASPTTFAREFLAVTAERGVKNGLLDRVVAALRKWLRRVMPNLRVTDAELRQLLVKSDQYLTRASDGRESVQRREAPAFSQGSSPLTVNPDQANAYRTQLANAMAVGGRTDRSIPIADAPAWLRAVGGSDNGLSIRKDTVLKATEGERRQGTGANHDVSMKTMQRLPELLTDPLMVFNSRTQTDALVALLDAKDMSGRQIVAALHLNQAEARYEIHRVASVYGKDGVAGFVRSDLSAGRLRYLNKAKGHEWLQSVGLQLPGEEAARGPAQKVVTDRDLVNSAPDFSFAGPGAETADLGALDRAVALEDMGRDSVSDRFGNQPGSPEETHIATGWHRGVDGKWRWEIDDSGATLLPAANDPDHSTHPLRMVLDHPALFAAYPRLAKIHVEMVPGLKSRGHFDPKTNTISMRDPSGYTETGETSMKSVLLHEVQHVIQTVEGFARGGNLADAKTLPEFQALLAQETAAGYTDAEYRAAMRTYAQLAGEVEARNTQERMNLTAAERRGMPPSETQDTGRGSQIVRFNATTSESRDGWDAGFPDTVTAHTPGFVRDHPDYAAAKSGDAAAALRLARDAVTPEFVERVRAALPEGSKPEIVPVLARESAGENEIPHMAAEVLAQQLGLKANTSIMQADKVSRGGSGAMHRLANQPAFEGKVEPGQAYVLLDDTLAQGGTLAQLKTHIEREGGHVVLATALTAKDYSRKLALDPASLRKVRGRFGAIEGWWKEQFGHGFDGLTESEARAILTFDRGRLSADGLRNRILAGKIPEVERVGAAAAGDRSGAEAPGASGQVSDTPKARTDFSLGSVVEADPNAKGLPVENVQRIAKDFIARYKGHIPLDVRVGKTLDDLYGPGSEAKLGKVAGAYHPARGILTLAAVRLQDRAAVETTLRHEILGHYGLNTLAPADKRAVLDAILASRSEPSLKEAWAIVDKNYADKSADMRAEEVFAALAEQERSTLGAAWDRILALVQKGLRAVGLLNGATSRAELQALARRIGQGIRSGEQVQRTFPKTDDAQFQRQEGPNAQFSRDEDADPDNPKPQRKKLTDAAESIEAIEETLPHLDRKPLQAVKDWIAGKARDLEPMALGALQLRHVLELAADDSTLAGPAKSYGNLYQRMDGDRNQMVQDGVTKVDALQKWARKPGLAGWLGKVRPEAHRLFKFMHTVTQLAVDPTNAYEKLLMRDRGNQYVPWTKDLIKERIKVLRATALTRSGDDKTRIYDEIKDLQNLPAREKVRQTRYPSLVAEWNALTPEAREHFETMRDHYKQQSLDLEAATIQQLQSMDIPDQAKRSALQMVRDNFRDNKVDGVYFPLSRFGDYWLSLRQKDGEYVFAKYESAAAMEQAEKRFLAAGAEIEARGRQDNQYRAKDAPSGTFIGDLMGVLKAAPEKMKDDIYQMYLKTLPALSLRKHGIHRKNVAGYSDDVPRAFAGSVFHGAHQISKARYGWQLQATMEQMRERMEARRTVISAVKAAHADALLSELARRHDWVMNPTNSQLASKMTSIGFTYYLAASPASALVNLIQVPQIVLPVLGARHGWGRSTRVLSKAMKEAISTGGHINKKLTGEDLLAFKALQEQGTFQRSAVHALAGISEGDQLRSSPAYTKVMNAVSWMFHTSEVINREATGIAAFRLAREGGATFNDAVKYADEITNGTHGDYSNANRARYMQGDTMKVLTQFKNYSLAMSWLWGRQFHQAFKGETPEVRQIARRTLTGLLGMTGLFAGVVGMPIFNLLRYGAMAAHAVGGDDDEPWDFMTEFRAWLAEHLGADAANLIADGAASQVLGANVASRVSMSDLWFRDADRQLEGEDAYNAMLQSIAGPLGGMIKNMYVGAKQFNDGHAERGIETMLPTFAKNAVKSVRYASQGVNTLRGDPIVADISGPEALIQAIGFQPTRVAQQQRTNNALFTYQQDVQDRRQALMNGFAMAQQAGDSGGTTEALRRIQAFNTKWPEIAIGVGNLRASLQSRARFSAEASNGIKINRKLESRLRQDVGAMAGTE